MPVALGADDPLLFGPRLTAQYEIARDVHGFTDPELADLARTSVMSSVAPEPLRRWLLAGIDDWLAAPAQVLFFGRTGRGTRVRNRAAIRARIRAALPSRPAPDHRARGIPAQRLGLNHQGDDPAITGEPPEERARQRPTRPCASPGRLRAISNRPLC